MSVRTDVLFKAVRYQASLSVLERVVWVVKRMYVYWIYY